ncbi:ATP-binding protein [Rhodocyclaceae bacterium]
MTEQIDALVAAAIHDAKNALQALDTQLAELQRRPTNADFSAARATTSRIAGQLAELLTLYRAQGGQLRLAIDDHDLHDFIDDLLTELGPLPGSIRLDVDRGAALTLGNWAFDAYLVKLALLDALRNALRQARTHVSLTLQAAPQGGIYFEVTDDGPGFPAAILDGERTASSEGTGLGLGFARLIAERHATPAGQHGHVALTNRPGASFTLTLP